MILQACKVDSEIETILSSVENVMHSHPDSALKIIENVEVSTLNTDELRAHYSLLLSQARDKNYIDEVNDPIIQVAISFYGNSGDDYKKMLSFYYLGRIQYNKGDYSDCIINFLKAEELAKDMDDWFYLGMIYRNIANVYAIVYSGKEQSKYYELSYEAFKNYADSSYTIYAKLELGRAYNNNMEYEKAVAIENDIISVAEAWNDTSLLVEALRIAAKSSYALNNMNESLAYYNRLKEIAGKESLSLIEVQIMSEAYHCIGESQKAIDILRDYTNNGSIDEYVPSVIYAHEGDFEKAYYSLKNESQLQDSIVWGLIRESVSKTVDDYNKYSNKVQNEIIQKQRVLFTSIILVALVVIAALGVLAKMRFALQKSKEENMILHTHNLVEEIKLKEEQNSAIKNSIIELLMKRFEDIDKLCLTFYEYKETGKEQKKIFEEVKKLIADLSEDATTLKNIEKYVNKYTDGIMERFRKEFPNLKDKDYILYMYLTVGFTARAISVFLNESVEAIYNRKSRLKSKIKASVSAMTEEFIFYLR